MPNPTDRPRNRPSAGRILGLALLTALAALADDRLTATGVTLPFVYLIPIGIAAATTSWRAGLGVVVVSAVANALLDQSRAAELANIGVVHAISALFFLLAVPFAAGASALGLGIGYLRLSPRWRSRLGPIRIGARVVILSADQPDGADPAAIDPASIVLRMDPGMAFGSGTHPTTRMCVALLEKLVKPGDRVFDLGSGTGILAIAAIKLGAASALAADIDPEAERKTRLNIALNGLEDSVSFSPGSLEIAQRGTPPATFEIVIVNILSDVLIALLHKGLADVVAPGGALLLSGIRVGQVGKLSEALLEAGFQVAERLDDATWVALVARAAGNPASRGAHTS